MLTYNDKIRPINGKIFVESEPLTLKVKGMSFPQNIVSDGASANKYLALYFNAMVNIKIDYGDGTVKFFNATTEYNSNFYSLFVSSNDEFVDFYPSNVPVYYYSTGDANTEREIKISYSRNNLTDFRQVGDIGLIEQNLNFVWAYHTNLEELAMNQNWVLNLDLNNISSNTNPFLKRLNLQFFSVNNPLSSFIPTEIFEIGLEELFCGTANFAGQSVTDINLDVLATKNIATTLTSLALDYYSGILPANIGGTLIDNLILDFTQYTTLPENIDLLTGLRTLYVRTSQQFIAIGYDVAPTIESFTMYGGGQGLAFSNLPTAWNTYNVLKYVSWRNNGLTVAANVDNVVNMMYDWITTNADITGTTTEFREVTIDITQTGGTNITGAIQAPTGYVQGSSNGTPANSGEQIYVLVNQYDCTILYT